MDDVEKFMELATAQSEKPKKHKRLREALDVLESQSPTKKEKKPKDGQLCQYAVAGRFHSPVTRTIKTLRPACYGIMMKPDGTLGYNLQHLTTDKLLRLPDSRSEEVVAEVERFWTLKGRFKEYGFAHKRGFLLYGPPGSGKTSTVALIIESMINKGGVVFLAEHPGMLAQALSDFRQIEPERRLVVILEDIDTIISNYGESQVLSILDGEHQVENVVFVATTNYPESLDGRVINRPSRFDRVVEIGMPNNEARALFLTAKIGLTEKDGLDLVKETEGMSIAHVKELIVSHFCQDTPLADVLKRLKRMKITPKSSGNSGPLGLG